MQDINLNQLKLKVSDSYEKDENLTTSFEAVNDEDLLHRAFPDTKLSKVEDQKHTKKKGVLTLICVTTNSLKRF